MTDFALGGNAKYFSTGAGSGSKGITITSSATADTMGSIVELDASTESDSNGFVVGFTAYSFASASPVSFLVDLLIGGGGSEEILVEGIHLYSDNSEANYTIQHFSFPIAIQSGTRISARCQTDTAAADAVILIMQMGIPSFESSPGFSRCTSIGFNKSTSNGATFDPGGTINTKGSWSEIVASSADDYVGFCLSIGSNLNTSQDSANWLMDIGVGSAGNEEVIAENIYCRSTSQEQLSTDGNFFGVSIPSGNRIAIRAQSEENDSTDRVRSYVFHPVVR